MGSIEYMGSQTFYIDDDGLCWDSKDKKTQFDIITKEPVSQENIIKSGSIEIMKRHRGRPKKAEVI